ncbi:Na+/H+ antiporter subunit E [Neptunomonas phycophila]|jgi:multicomponent K+:H+ antiporter subunit E|uniref:Na+/H+ antiporter subunit E n=1 Tax=Neptunomonas phycophila TaxID=1572645 RepID=A0ABT9EX54_9GAMM|nr:Na+/H+ antiporter subunit E [Neptunomonas phycophila]MDO6784139.1 Na+/H+ antiporter subunit E [Neptunomonas phycophila]MDP2523623.1 Na+/H+ antiporter subunit E [Neptunomonas phycophila]
MLRRIFPMPTHSLVLFIVWLLLNQSIAPGHLLLALIFALLIPILVGGMQAEQPHIRRPIKAVIYFLRVLVDIIVANIEVTVQLMRPVKYLQPAFVAIPLELTGDFPITVLASTISLTPGTLSAEVSEDKQWLYVHALHMKDETTLVREIKKRYEAPLLEIFGC